LECLFFGTSLDGKGVTKVLDQQQHTTEYKHDKTPCLSEYENKKNGCVYVVQECMTRQEHCLNTCEPIKKMKLMLVRIKPYHSKVTDSQRYKYIFVNEAGTSLVAYSDDLKYEDRVTSSLIYDAARAHEYAVEYDTWDEKVTQKVIL